MDNIHLVDIDRLFQGVSPEASDDPPRKCGPKTYLKQNARRKNEVDQKIEDAEIRGKVAGYAVGGSAGAVGGYCTGTVLTAKLGITGKLAAVTVGGPALVGMVAVGHITALTAGNRARKRALVHEMNKLKGEELFDTWRKTRTKKRQSKLFKPLRINLDHEIVFVGEQPSSDTNYRCGYSTVLLYNPRAVCNPRNGQEANGQYVIFDKSLLAYHRPNENGRIVVGDQQISARFIKNTLRCMGIKLDCLRGRISFIEKLTDAHLNGEIEFGDQELLTLRGFKRYLEDKLDENKAKLDKRLGENRAEDAAEKALTQQKFTLIKNDNTAYPYSSNYEEPATETT